MKKTSIIRLITAASFSVAISTGAFAAGAGAGPAASVDPSKHFHPKGKMPSQYTRQIFKEARASLPFSDRQDFEEEERGFIAAPKSKKIMADAGNVAWDMERYEFLADAEQYNSIHPSMLRQSQLNMNFGLYKVVDGVYQVRGFDLANITFMQGKTGWIVFDPLTAAETSRAVKKLLDEHVGKQAVVAVIYSHSHADHWGGVRGIVDEADVRAGKVEIIAPRDFMQYPRIFTPATP